MASGARNSRRCPFRDRMFPVAKPAPMWHMRWDVQP